MARSYASRRTLSNRPPEGLDLIPSLRLFIANWFVTEDHLRGEGGLWVHENFDITDARDIIGDVPEPFRGMRP